LRMRVSRDAKNKKVLLRILARAVAHSGCSGAAAGVAGGHRSIMRCAIFASEHELL
jgi:hypothetical protein